MKLDDIYSIDIKNLSFSYDNYKCKNAKLLEEFIDIEKNISEYIFTNFNYKFEKGSIYSIIGENGSGKSTIINLIIGLFTDEYKGKIYYNDIDISEIDMIDVRRNLIGIAEQEPLLLNNSILYNITFNENMSIDNKSLYKYLQVLNMYKFIEENTLSFIIDEKNTNLSGGEKQKIAILKVLYKNPKVMVFDEPTSALDFKTRKKFIEYLNEIKEDKIIIIITHDSVISDNTDKVLDLSNKLR